MGVKMAILKKQPIPNVAIIDCEYLQNNKLSLPAKAVLTMALGLERPNLNNGYFSTATSWNSHTNNTNAGQTAEDGVWFGGGNPDDNKCKN
ncbi:hypothetical protein JCM13267_09240 [Howardella ureilytica]